MKRFIALFLIALITLSCIPSFAQDSVTYAYDETSKTLTISGNGAMDDYTSGSACPYSTYKNEALHIVIENGVTSIGAYSFYNFAQLKDVTIADTVKAIGTNAFFHCTSLKNVNIPGSVERICNGAFSYCSAMNDVTFNYGLKYIEYSAFSSCGIISDIKLPESVLEVENSAFARLSNLTSFTMSGSVTFVDDSVFYRCSSLADVYYSGTQRNWNDIFFGEENECLTDANIHLNTHNHAYGEFTNNNDATCEKNGTQTKVCRLCNDKVAEEITDSALGHDLSEWRVVAEPTTESDGIKERVCSRCDYKETEVLAKLTVPTLSSEGVTLTVNGLCDVDTIFIGKGNLTTYREVKNNLIVSASANRFVDDTYTYICPKGDVTVYAKYKDSSRADEILHTTLTVIEPEIVQFGLQVKLSNLEGVKSIRTAYGEYTSLQSMKKADGVRAYSGNTVVNGEFLLQYRTNGRVTVFIQYSNGYNDISYYDIEQKVPTFEIVGNRAVIGNITDLYAIRYAKGTYATSSQIKNAVGSVVVKPTAAVDGVITTKALEKGTYTFCVQYLDESYNYYTVTIG